LVRLARLRSWSYGGSGVLYQAWITNAKRTDALGGLNDVAYPALCDTVAMGMSPGRLSMACDLADDGRCLRPFCIQRTERCRDHPRPIRRFEGRLGSSDNSASATRRCGHSRGIFPSVRQYFLEIAQEGRARSGALDEDAAAIQWVCLSTHQIELGETI
jgi:hypothetical protein